MFPEEAKRLRNELHAWLLEAGINGATGDDIILAASEAFLNAAEDPVDRPAAAINVDAEITDNDVIVTVSKRSQLQLGPGLSRDHYSHVLIRALMSRMQIETDPAGTKVRLQKTIAKGRSLGQPEAPDGEPATA
jgi:anti-sigma regulatory factor (Ser/Thr protein kinase)